MANTKNVLMSPNSAVLFLLLITDFFLCPVKNAQPAVVSVLAVLLAVVVIYLVFAPIAKKSQRLQQNEVFGYAVLTLLFLADAALYLVQTERFYRLIGGENTPAVLFVGLFLLLGCYACSCGKPVLQRMSGVLLLALLVSAALLLVANISQMKVQNLQWPAVQAGDVLLSASGYITFLPEILLYLLLPPVQGKT